MSSNVVRIDRRIIGHLARVRPGRSADWSTIYNLPVTSFQIAATNLNIFFGDGFDWTDDDGDESTSTVYRPHIRYSYRVDGANYTADTWKGRLRVSSGSPKYA